MNANVKRCALCGQDHDALDFKELARPLQYTDGKPWTHWAICPIKGDPILMRMETVFDPELFDKPDRLTIKSPDASSE